MRKELQRLLDKKVGLKGTLERYGTKTEYIGGDTVTMLLKDITLVDELENKVTLDHAWLKVGKTLAKKNIKIGSVVAMNCHVKEYTKGYVHYDRDIMMKVDERTIDYGIQRASKINILKNGKGLDFKEFFKEKEVSGHFMSNKYGEKIEKNDV